MNDGDLVRGQRLRSVRGWRKIQKVRRTRIVNGPPIHVVPQFVSSDYFGVFPPAFSKLDTVRPNRSPTWKKKTKNSQTNVPGVWKKTGEFLGPNLPLRPFNLIRSLAISRLSVPADKIEKRPKRKRFSEMEELREDCVCVCGGGRKRSRR